MTHNAASKAVVQYLARYAEPQAVAADRVKGQWPHAVAVPLCAEEDLWPQALAHLAQAAQQAGGALCVLTVNAPEDAPEDFHAANQRLLAVLLNRLENLRPLMGDAHGPWAWLGVWPGGLDILLLDRASEGGRMPAGQGVGLARKTGADLALALWQQGKLLSPWLFHTDADALLPPDYFLAAAGAPENAVALTLPFAHGPAADPALRHLWPPLALYEISLRYYVLGLHWAGSPHAFHTVGSTLATRHGAYAAVRGFPRRNAAEDFYLLDKLSALGPVFAPASPLITLPARVSARVPFGTGRAVQDIGQTLAQGDDFTLYHPACFAALKSFLEVLEEFARAPDGSRARRGLTESDPALGAMVAQLGGPEAVAGEWEKLAHQNSGPALRRWLHGWFGGLKTLRAVHAVRDGALANLPWPEALQEAPFTALGETFARAPDKALHTLFAYEKARLHGHSAGVWASPPLLSGQGKTP